MKIPRKKEKARTTSYYTENKKQLPTWFEITKKELNRRNGSYDKEQCEKCL